MTPTQLTILRERRRVRVAEHTAKHVARAAEVATREAARAQTELVKINTELAVTLDALELIATRWGEVLDKRAKAYRDARACLRRHGRK